MVKVNLENPFFTKSKPVKIGRGYWQEQANTPTILKQKDKWVADKKKRDIAEFKRYANSKAAKSDLAKYVAENTIAPNDNAWANTGKYKNPELQNKFQRGAKSHALWEKEHPVLNAVGTIAGAAPLAAAAYPLGAVAGETVAPALANPYVDTALKAMAVADAGDNIINNRIKTPYDGAMAALELAPVITPYAIKGYTAMNNSIDNSVNRFKNNLKSATTWRGKLLNDVINYPRFTANAMLDGRYIYNKKSLIKHARKAMNSINKGYSTVDDAYNKMVGFTPSEPRTKLGYSEKTASSSFFNPITNKIKIGFNYRNSNVVKDPDITTITAGHERVHSHNTGLNRTYNTPNLGIYSNKTDYYIPNPNHPIARKYLKFFENGPSHGMYPEETFANALGFKAAYPNTTVSKAVQFSNAKEGMHIPPEFIHDYIHYIKDTYK